MIRETLGRHEILDEKLARERVPEVPSEEFPLDRERPTSLPRDVRTPTSPRSTGPECERPIRSRRSARGTCSICFQKRRIR